MASRLLVLEPGSISGPVKESWGLRSSRMTGRMLMDWSGYCCGCPNLEGKAIGWIYDAVTRGADGQRDCWFLDRRLGIDACLLAFDAMMRIFARKAQPV